MSSKTEIFVLKEFAAPPAKGLRRRKPWTREDHEVTQKHRLALLDQIRSHRQQTNPHSKGRIRSPSPVAFGKSKTLNRQFSKSANDVKEVVAERSDLAKVGTRKLALSQICLPTKDDNFEVKFTNEGVRCSKTDLSKIPIVKTSESVDDCKIVELHPKLKIPEISKVPEPDDVKEIKPKSPTVIPGPDPKILNRQKSKSAIDIRKPGGGHFGLKVIGSQQIALSQIWTVPTNCGCCGNGKDENCKHEKSKTPELEKPKVFLTTTEEEDDDDDSYAIVKMLTWVGRMLIKNPKPKPKWVVLQVPVVPRVGTTKDANASSTKTSHLYLNVIVEAGSGLISITPVASFEELIKACVIVKKEEEEKPKYILGLYPEFFNGPL